MTGELIDVFRPSTTGGSWGDDVLTYPDTATHTIAGAAIEPRTTSEQLDGRTAVLVGLRLYLPAGADIEPTDRLGIRGDLYEVDGEIAQWRNPHGAGADGDVVDVKRVTG